MHTESILDDYMFARVYNYACLCVGGWASMCIIMFGRVPSSLLKGHALVHSVEIVRVQRARNVIVAFEVCCKCHLLDTNS